MNKFLFFLRENLICFFFQVESCAIVNCVHLVLILIFAEKLRMAHSVVYVLLDTQEFHQQDFAVNVL